MSKRIHSCRDRRSGVRLIATFVMATQLLWVSAGLAGPKLVLNFLSEPQFGAPVSVALDFSSSDASFRFAAFDLLITFDDTVATLLNVSKGSLITQCGWEYFTFRQGVAVPASGSPVSSVRVIAVANDPVTPGDPACFLGADSGQLAVLEFQITSDTTCSSLVPEVNFFWADCADNALASVGGDSLFVADLVHEWFNPGIAFMTPNSLGTIEGLPNSCLLSPIGELVLTRLIDITHGVLPLPCNQQIDHIGDLNRNGIAYEIADAVLFTNFFLYGLDAFDPNPQVREIQIAASDCNRDGETLTYRDLVYLLRVIIGDALPAGSRVPIPDTLSATFNQNVTGRTISVISPATLAGGVFYFTGEISPTFYVPVNQPYGYVAQSDGRSVVLIDALAGRGMFPDGIWFTYAGDGVLDSVLTADWSNNYIVTSIQTIDPQTVCGDANFDQRINITDAVYLIRYVFSGGPPPLDALSGDVDCNSSINAADAVHLINYIFAGGYSLCQGCR